LGTKPKRDLRIDIQAHCIDAEKAYENIVSLLTGSTYLISPGQLH